MDPNVKTYLITWTCYGNWLHGDARGSADRKHNMPGTPYLAQDDRRRIVETDQLKHPPYQLACSARPIVLRAIWEVCEYRKWELIAVHVQTTHIHVVVMADMPPERVMNDLKAYASRALNAAGIDGGPLHRWTRHGSTRYLNSADEIEAAVRYVLERQGSIMTTWGIGDGEPNKRPDR